MKFPGAFIDQIKYDFNRIATAPPPDTYFDSKLINTTITQLLSRIGLKKLDEMFEISYYGDVTNIIVSNEALEKLTYSQLYYI